MKQINKFAAPDNNVIETHLGGPSPAKATLRSFSKRNIPGLFDSVKFTMSPFEGTLVAALAVVSAGSLAFLFAYVALKFRRNGRRILASEENPQMEWDDSGLNIIENPIEIVEVSPRVFGF
jgi:hypothetical protein